MSYSRDRDAATRGVGAIASSDMANPGRARRRAAAQRAQIRSRDAAMHGWTYGPQGGLGISKEEMDPPVGQDGPGRPTRPIPTTDPPPGGRPAALKRDLLVGSTRPASAVAVSDPRPIFGIVVDPGPGGRPEPPTPPRTQPTRPPIVSGGGGGGGAGILPTKTTMPELVGGAVLTDPDDAPSSPAMGSHVKTLAMVGAGVFVAYLLLRDRH